MICNLPTDFLQICRSSTNIVIHRRLTKIIDNRFTWLDYDFFNRLAKFFIFGMPTQFLAKGFVWLEMLLSLIYIQHWHHNSTLQHLRLKNLPACVGYNRWLNWTVRYNVKFAEPVRHYASMVLVILLGYNLKIVLPPSLNTFPVCFITFANTHFWS